MNRPLKESAQSHTTNTYKLRYDTLNGENHLFGGRLMAFIDEIGTITAERHSGQKVTTASVNNLVFKKGAHLNDLLVLDARITYVGNTSMEVCVESYVEKAGGERDLINKAYLTYVALDEETGRPTAVKYGLRLTTEEEKAEFEKARERRRKDIGT